MNNQDSSEILTHMHEAIVPKQNGGFSVTNAKKMANDMLKSGEITLKTLEVQAGYSRSAWSQYFKGKYRGTVEQVDAALIRFLTEWIATERLIPITSFKSVHTICGLTNKTKSMAVVYGDSGVGKTAAVKHFAQTNDDVIIITANRAVQAGELLIQIVKRIGESYSSYGSLNSRIMAIQNALRRHNRLLIIDEADQLPVRTLEMVRAIYDDGCTGLVLIGLPRIIELMTKGRSLKENLAQLYSRALKWRIVPPTKGDVRAIINRYNYHLSPKTVNEVEKWIRGSGELRKVTMLMERAEDVAAWSNQAEVNDSVIRETYDILIGGEV